MWIVDRLEHTRSLHGTGVSLYWPYNFPDVAGLIFRLQGCMERYPRYGTAAPPIAWRRSLLELLRHANTELISLPAPVAPAPAEAPEAPALAEEALAPAEAPEAPAGPALAEEAPSPAKARWASCLPWVGIDLLHFCFGRARGGRSQ